VELVFVCVSLASAIVASHARLWVLAQPGDCAARADVRNYPERIERDDASLARKNANRAPTRRSVISCSAPARPIAPSSKGALVQGPSTVYKAGVRVAVPSISSALVALFAVGCGGGGELRGSLYRDQEAQYEIGPRGSDWRALRVEEHNDLAWESRRDGAVVQINSTCDPTSDVPLVSLTNHLLMGFTARDVREQELVPLDGREALRTHLVASLDGVPRELILYVLKKDDCVYDMALIAPQGASFTRAQTDFEAFAHGFTTNTR
jgi:hypothetical protein